MLRSELVNAGLSVDSRNLFGATPLHGQPPAPLPAVLYSKNVSHVLLAAAAFGGHGTVAQELIKLGSDIHAEDKEGFTAADLAEAAGYVDLASMLLPQ
eukprot:767131-Hanusia_phi.AAC.3